MKMIRPALGIACLALASCGFFAARATAAPGASLPTVKINAEANSGAMRIEAQATGAFAYRTSQPNDRLLVVDLPGVTAADAEQSAQAFATGAVAGYRLVPYSGSEGSGVRIEIVLATPMQPRVERSSDHALTLIFDGSSSVTGTKLSHAVAVLHSGTARISHVDLAQQNGQPVLKISAVGELHYHATRLENPDRVILDFADATMAATSSAIPANSEVVRSVRVGQFQPDVARVVVKLDRWREFNVLESKEGLTVTFGAPSTLGTEETADAKAGTSQPAAQTSMVSLPAWLTQPSEGLASPKDPQAAQQQQAPAPATNSQADNTTSAANTTGSAVATPQQVQQQGMPLGTQSAKYTGEPINVNFKDVDLKDFFRLIHEISGLNVVLDPSVHGNLTLVLDNVPWDQALDIVLKNNNLAKQLDGNVLRIATQDTLKAEAQSRADLQKAEAAAVETVTVTRQLSYARVGMQAGAAGGASAKPIEMTLKSFLSPRGDIVADARTNTLIIKDIPSQIPIIDNLLRQLDKRSPQVEIDARIVAASRQFARDIGMQLAAAAANSQAAIGGASSAGTSPITHSTPVPFFTNSSGGGSSTCPTSTCTMPLISNLPAVAPTSGLSFAYQVGSFALDAILTASESRGAGQVLSRPMVFTQDNFKGTVKQGEQIPIQTEINNTISTQYVDAVLELDVTPHITADGTIAMDVHLENTAIDPGVPAILGQPALSTQSVDNKIIARDGSTVMLGGVNITQQNVTINQVPFFGSIPVVGNLFREKAINVKSSELIFFLTPRVVGY
jgi:type IV pilus assembly protein PilQ